MSTHQANKDKPRAQKCRHFCFSFDTHNFCPTCREAGKGDDPCVTFETPCEICTSFTDEQLQKIQNRKRYLKKQKATTSSKDELDLLGEGDGDSFTGSNADLECAADSLFTSPPRPQPLAFSSLSLKTPAKTIPPTPGTALQNKIQKNIEKSLGDSLNIHLQQQMGSFQASMLEAFQSLREELAVKQKVEVQSSLLASKPGLSSNSAAPLDLPPPRSGTNIPSEDMDVDYGPALPPRLVSTQPSSDQYVAPSEGHPEEVSYSHKKQSHKQPVDPGSASDQLNEDSDEPRIPSSRSEKHSDKSKHKSRSRYVSFTSEEEHSPETRHRSSKPSRAQPSGVASDQDLPQHDPDPPYYREVALSDMPSQYSEEVDTLIIIIAPGWPGMPWFWDLVQLSTEIPLQLPVSTTLLKQSHKLVFHNNPQHLNLHAWCLGADNSKNKASLWRWQRELLPLSGHQQGPSTSQSGPYLKNGAEKIRWISPLHL